MNKIIVRTGTARITEAYKDTGGLHPNGTLVPETAPCRVKVWRVI